MRSSFRRHLQTPAVEAAQLTAYGRVNPARGDGGEPRAMGADELGFIAARDSFYLASVGETGWPYVQHRGGPTGFVQVSADGKRLAWADYAGNRQLISTGNVAVGARVALFLMDYPAQERLKIIGRARVGRLEDEPEWVGRLLGPGGEVMVERVFVVDVVGFDWNCPKFITPRYTAAQVAEATQPLHDRIVGLERELAIRRASGSA